MARAKRSSKRARSHPKPKSLSGKCQWTPELRRAACDLYVQACRHHPDKNSDGSVIHDADKGRKGCPVWTQAYTEFLSLHGHSLHSPEMPRGCSRKQFINLVKTWHKRHQMYSHVQPLKRECHPHGTGLFEGELQLLASLIAEPVLDDTHSENL